MVAEKNLLKVINISITLIMMYYWVKPIFPLDFIDDESVNEIYSSHALEYFDFESL